MIRMWLVSFILLGSLLVGCTAQPIDYRSGERMEGPGLLVKDSPYASKEGFRVYSDDSDLPSLMGRNRAKSQAGESNIISAEQLPDSASGSVPSYEQFKEFETYKKFNNLPKNSSEYQQFQQWKNYQAWKKQQTQSKQ